MKRVDGTLWLEIKRSACTSKVCAYSRMRLCLLTQETLPKYPPTLARGQLKHTYTVGHHIFHCPTLSLL